MQAATLEGQETVLAATRPFSERARLALRRVLRGRPLWIGLALFLLACATRLMLVRTARFTGDEVRFWQAATGIATGTSFPLLGPSITGGGAQHPGPLFYALMAVPLFFSKAPEACNVFVALLGGCSVVLYWSALRPYFGQVGATFAALLMACMPWCTMYGERIWNPNALVFLLALAFWSACRMRRKPSLGALILLLVSSAGMPHFHMSSPMVWLALSPIFLPSFRRWRWYWVPVALGCAAILYVPMLISETRTHWMNAHLFLTETGKGAFPDDWKRVPLWAFRLLTLDISYQQLHSYWGEHTEGQMLSFLVHGNEDFTWSPIRWLLVGLSFVFAAFTVVHWVTRSTRRGRPFLWAALVGLVTNTLLLEVAHKPIHGHYVSPLLPFYFVAFAALGRAAIQWKRAYWLVYGGALVMCLGGIDAALWVSHTLDARTGLGTIREVIAAIEKDHPGARSVSLSYGFHGSPSGFGAIGALTQPPLAFNGGPQYRLMLRDAPAPTGSHAIMSTGPVTLYGWR